MEHQKKHRLELMEKLRSQLEELEQCAQEVRRGGREVREGERGSLVPSPRPKNQEKVMGPGNEARERVHAY